jgi:hypothetical protein
MDDSWVERKDWGGNMKRFTSRRFDITILRGLLGAVTVLRNPVSH